jgi:exonuclease SbcC
MRLHRLSVRAFGPFAGHEEVDFDALCDSGLFLLHGPTGAGKTSVLDAVCFALYGVVPGARSRGARLRSDHAAEGVAPEVVCEFSVGPRRFEVTRSPAWERPKRRGEGITTEQARVLVRELRDGSWRSLTSRLDEAGHLLDGVLGLGHEQFTKLVLLPQGDFAAFLRADAEARRAMLERLFETDRFSSVQRWLRDRHQELRQDVDEARTVTRELLARAAQAAAGLPADPIDTAQTTQTTQTTMQSMAQSAIEQPAGDQPAGEQPAAVAAEAAPVPPRAQVAALLARALRAWEDATSHRAATETDRARAQAAHDAGAALARRQAEHAVLRAAADRLAADEPCQAGRRDRLRDADRALGLVPVAPALQRADERLAEAEAGLLAATAAVTVHDATLLADGSLLADALVDQGVLLLDTPAVAAVGEGALATTAGRLRETVGGLSAIEREAAGLPAALRAVEVARGAVQRAESALERALATESSLESRLEQAQRSVASARERAALVPAARVELAAAQARAQAVIERDQLAAAVEAARPALQQARVERDDAREAWLDLREQRLDGMAAELAAGLTRGAACAVCGSLEHPDPARPRPSAVTDAQEQAAKERVDLAETTLADLDAATQAVTQQLAAAARAAADLDAAEAMDRAEQARAALAGAQRAARGIPAGEAAVQKVLAESAEVTTALNAARSELHGRATELATLTAAADLLAERVDSARGQDATVTARIRRLNAASAALERLLSARREFADSSRAAATVRRTASSAAGQAGFEDVASAVAAVLTPEQRSELEQQVRVHDSALATVTAQLSDPQLATVADLPGPDIASLASALILAQGDDAACADRVALAEQAAQALRQIRSALDRHLRQAEPLAQRYHLLNELFRCAEGTGGDNALRMSLSAFVLAARLEQVAEAASVRLAQMSGGRYTLVHSDEVTKGRQRSGLGLHVVDGWTGQRRETSTLSGGESFYTSLALALGLADVVSAEAGGTAIETLFVDEGFGTLDEDTLEEVMDVLDGLRSGGRAVGLVSHVTDLRTRIPAQLEVIKDRNGSHLRVAAS